MVLLICSGEMKNTIVKAELLKKYLDNKCTPEEINTLFRILSGSSDDQDLDNIIREYWESSEDKVLPSTRLAPITDKVLGKIRKDRISAKRFRFNRMLKYAAILILPLGICLFLIIRSLSVIPETLYTTSNHESREIVLPDNSKVTLNANSQLTLRKDFLTADRREVLLEGEAYFDVSRDDGAKLFRVITTDLVVEVHGTVFNVNNRWNQTEVVLEEGKVLLELKSDENEVVVMEPGDLAGYSAELDSSWVEKKMDQTYLHTSWKDGILVFTEKSKLSDAFRKLEPIYGVRFQYDTIHLEEEPLQFSLPMNDLESVLQIMKKLTGLNYTLNEDIVKVTKRE